MKTEAFEKNNVTDRETIIWACTHKVIAVSHYGVFVWAGKSGSKTPRVHADLFFWKLRKNLCFQAKTDMSEQGLKFILNHKSYAHIRNVKKPAFEYLLPVPGS